MNRFWSNICITMTESEETSLNEIVNKLLLMCRNTYSSNCSFHRGVRQEESGLVVFVCPPFTVMTAKGLGNSLIHPG